MVTRPLIFSGRRLQVNADTQGGSLAVEIIGSDGKPLPGFALNECDAVRTNSIAKSSVPLVTRFNPSGILPIVSPKSDGAATSCILAPDFKPSFWTSGVPEYPAGRAGGFAGVRSFASSRVSDAE